MRGGFSATYRSRAAEMALLCCLPLVRPFYHAALRFLRVLEPPELREFEHRYAAGKFQRTFVVVGRLAVENELTRTGDLVLLADARGCPKAPRPWSGRTGGRVVSRAGRFRRGRACRRRSVSAPSSGNTNTPDGRSGASSMKGPVISTRKEYHGFMGYLLPSFR